MGFIGKSETRGSPFLRPEQYFRKQVSSQTPIPENPLDDFPVFENARSMISLFLRTSARCNKGCFCPNYLYICRFVNLSLRFSRSQRPGDLSGNLDDGEICTLRLPLSECDACGRPSVQFDARLS